MTRYEAYKHLNAAIDKLLDVMMPLPSGDPKVILILDAIREIDGVRASIGKTAQHLEVPHD